eukprot:13214356-Alexandrium_andersonii.AAC.1
MGPTGPVPPASRSRCRSSRAGRARRRPSSGTAALPSAGPEAAEAPDGRGGSEALGGGGGGAALRSAGGPGPP